jgi:uncharacterized hydrophobic protein (TIGR00271 family)
VLHLRIITPPADRDGVLDLLGGDAGVCNVVVLPGAAVDPPGDLVLCDVAREDASVVLGGLTDLGLDRSGSIAAEEIDLSLSVRAAAAERLAPGDPADAVVWEQVSARTGEEAHLSWAYLAFLVVACLIAGAGILLDSSVLIVGAMVVGPEFGPVAGLCVAIATAERHHARRSLAALAVGFPTAIAAAAAGTLVARAAGLVPAGFAAAERPLTGFVATVDPISLVVALLAGATGILSLTSGRSGTLVGVLISVTTVPAAADVGVSAAVGDWSEAAGAAAQLGGNVLALVIGGTATLLVQRRTAGRRRAPTPSDQR